MITTAILGAGLGLGLWLLTIALFPARPPLASVIAGLDSQPSTLDAATNPATWGWAAKAGRPFVAPLRALGAPGKRMQADLALLGVGSERHLATKATCALAGPFATAAAFLLLTASAGAPPGGVFVIAGLALAVAGFLLPDIRVRSQAERRRADFRHALSAYLDMVVISLAGGAGVDQALHDSAATGTGWAFERLKTALESARLTRATPWTTLRRLGDELAIGELAELAASVSLAGTEGAKVRASLAAKADALRTRQLNQAEGHEQSATERMSLPVTVLFLGFLVFIAYPAIHQIIAAL